MPVGPWHRHKGDNGGGMTWLPMLVMLLLILAALFVGLSSK